MKKVLSTLLAATLLLTTVTGLQGLSVSAEDGAAAGTSNELIANGNFEGADTVLLEENFDNLSTENGLTYCEAGKLASALTGNTGWVATNNTNDKFRKPTVSENALNFRGQMRIAKIISDANCVTADQTIKVKFKWKNTGTDNSAGLVFYIAKLSNVGKVTWTTNSYYSGNVMNLKPSESYADMEIKLTAQSGWQNTDNEQLVFGIFYNPYVGSKEVDTPNMFIDDLKLVKEYVAPSNAVTGTGSWATPVVDPDNAENHCLKIASFNHLKVQNFALKANTFYKISYDYKAASDYSYAENQSQQMWFLVTSGNSESDRLPLYDKNGEPLSRNAVSAWSANLAQATDWKSCSVVFKTEDVDSNKFLDIYIPLANTEMYFDNLSVTELVSATAVQDGFDFLGTAIRSEKEYIDKQELRFKAEVKKEALEAGHYNGFTVTEYGFLAFRKDYLANQDSPLTMNVEAKKGEETKTVAVLKREAYVADVTGTATTDIVYKDEGDTKQFHARLTGFNPETNYDKTYLVRTYAKLKNADGVELTVYLSETTGLGVYALAYAVLTNQNKDGTYVENIETRKNMWELLNKYYTGTDYDIGEKPQA